MSRIDGATSRFGQRLRRGLLMLLALGSAGWLSAADGDADGLPDDVETALGTDPAVGEVFTTLLERAVPARVQDKARGITAVAMANAGGNRFVWRLTFAADYPKTNSNLVFYLDADNNPATGRQGHGCEAMLIINDGAGSTNGFNPDGSSRPAEAPRAAVVGPHLYISADIDLLQQDGQSVLRFMALSETWTPHQGVDNVPYTIAKGPAVSTRPKVKLDSDITVSVGVLRTFGPRTIDPIVADPSNHRLRVFDCTLEGFRFVPSEYRADNVIRTGLPARIVGTAPAAGSFHVGVVMHDAAGREVMALAVNDRRVGVAVADWDDNNQHLFVTAEPVAVQAGDRIELRALNSDGLCRVEDLVLLRQPPAARQAPCQILHLAATADRLTWITTWPAACTVELADGRTITESEPWNNHRVAIPGLQPGQAVRCRVTATARDGSAVHSDWLDYTWQAPVEPPTPAAGKVRLQVTPPAGVALRDWPVTGGVPFPRGVLGSTASLHLRDAAGALQPLQASVSSRWQDGSVKWALIDFRHSGPAATYDLAYGPNAAPAGSRPAAPAAAPATTLGRLQLTDAAGKDFAAEIQAGTLETNGALRLEHAGSGSLVNPDGSRCFAYEASLQRYPGTPWTRALLTIVNDADAAEFTTVESLRWELPATAPAAAFVRQHRDDQYQSSSGDGRRWSGPLGAVMVRDFWQNYPLDLEVGPQGSALWLWPRLRQDEVDWAKGTVDEHRLFYWFEPIPARQAGGYKLRQGMTKTYEVWLGADGATPPYDRPLMPVCTPQWYADSMVFGELTVANPDRDVVNQYDVKVNEAFDAYMKAREDNREYGQFNFGDWWGERVINWGNIEYDTQHAFFLQFARSGDLRFLQAGEEAERHNRDVDTVHAHQDPRRVGRVYAHCIGHVGDYYQKSPLEGPNRGSPRGGFTPSHTWCEGHTDHFFLTGERRSQATAAKIADHYGTYGTRDYDFRNCREPGWDLIFTMAVYRGTSDPFYLNAARIIVERVLERQTPEPALGTAGGGWRRRMVPGHCLCEPAHYGNAGFMVGVLLTGLKWYHLETGDARVAESLHQGARFLANDMWEPDIQGFRYTTCPKSSKGAWSNLLLFDGMGYAYRLTGDKDIARVLMAGTDAAIESLSGWGKSYTMYIRVAPHVLGLLADLRETPPMPLPRLLADVPTAFSGRQAVRFDASTSVVPKGLPVTYAWAFGDGTTGTGATVEKTYAPGQYRAVLTVGAGDATETAETTVVMPPLSTLAKLDDRAVVVEAETFAAQGGGQVKTASGRRGASGSIVTGWEDAIGHWLEWKASVPRAGRYHLLLKYCSGATNPRRELRLNGQVPGEAAREIRFEPTGGYSTGTDNWAYLTVGGNDAPMVLDLPAGESTLRLTNLGDGLALDWILLRPVD